MRGPSRRLLVLIGLMALGVISGCSEKPAKTVVQVPDVTVTRPERREVIRYFEYTGTTAALQAVEIRARVTGFLDKICFTPGAKVKEGDLLFVIDPRQFEAAVKQAQAKLNAQKAGSKLAQTELRIARQLESKEAISGLQLDKKTAESDVAQADVELAEASLEEAKLRLLWTKVTSPISGRVSRNLVDVGNLVGEAEKTLLTTVVDDESIYAYFNLSELDLLPIRRKYPRRSEETPLADLKVPAELGLADEKGYPHKGLVNFADTQVDPSTGTLQVRAIFPNKDGLLMAGMFVRVRVPIDASEKVLVPDVAIQTDQAGSYVLTVNGNNVVEQLRVELGQKVDSMQVIEKGLKGDELVIIKGLLKARPGAKVNPIRAESGSLNPSNPVQSGKATD